MSREPSSSSSGYRDVLYGQYGTLVEGRARPLTRDDVNRWASGWERHIRDWLPKDRSAAILDLGCGSGKVLAYLEGQGYQFVWGIDVSAEQIESARHLHDRVECIDAKTFLSSRPQQFDLIFAIDVVEHHTRDELIELLANCFQSLRTGGRLIVQTPNGESPFHGHDLFGDLSHELCLTPKSLGQLMRNAGFADYAARECGPIPHGTRSIVRYGLWRVIRKILLGINLVETGSRGSGVLTRVFAASGVKP